MTRKKLLDIINEEIIKVKWGIVKEEITTEDEKKAFFNKVDAAWKGKQGGK